VDRDGNVLVTGESHGRGTSLDFATVKYSAAGIPLWTNRYNAPANREDRAIAVAVDRSGNVFVTGYSARSLGGSLYDCATIKYSAAGVPLWTNVQPGYVTALALDDSGSVFVSTASATVKYSGTGVTLWTNRYPGYAAALSVDGSGNVFVTGDSYNTNNDYDYVMVKYTGDGVPLWTNSYNGPAKGNDWARAVAIGPDGAIYVTGESDGDYSSGTGYDFATIKYVPVPVVAIERSAANVLVSWPSAFSDFVLEQNTGSLSPANWSTVTDPIQNDGTNRTLVVNPPSGDRFYRLFKR